jgi:hypothetical protein
MGYIGNQSLTVLQEVNIGQVVGTDTASNILAKPNDNGALWISSDTGQLYLNDGTQWVDLGQLKGDTGPTGDTGVSITGISRTSGDGSLGTTDTYTITFSDASTSTFDVTRTAGDGSEGSTDTYTVYGDVANTEVLGTFDVYNGTDGTNITNVTSNKVDTTTTVTINGDFVGAPYTFDVEDGQSVDHVTRTVGDGSSGTTDTYTIYGDVAETVVIGTFDVYNGNDGIVASVVAGPGISIDNTDPANPVINVTGLVGSIDDLSDVDTSTVAPENGQGLVWDGTSWVPGTIESGNITYTKTVFTATEGQTTFNVAYSAGQVEVYLLGLLLDSTDYVADNETSIVLNAGVSAGDIVTVVAYNPIDLVDTYTKAEVDTALSTKQDTGINPVVASIVFGG